MLSDHMGVMARSTDFHYADRVDSSDIPDADTSDNFDSFQISHACVGPGLFSLRVICS